MSASLQNEATRRPEVSPALMARPGLVLRKCACGGAAGMSGDCPECSEKRLSLQRKVSRPGDELELEADRIAEQVMGSLRQPSPSQRRSAAALGNSLVRRSDLDKDSIYRQASADESPQSTAPAPTPAPTPSPPTVHSPPGPAATTATAQPASAGLIVEDDAREIASGQMRKSQFLDELKSAVCSAADAELAAVGRSAQGCPYIENWINHYRSKDSRYVERALHKYAPEAAGITSARDYIPIVSNRIQRSVSVWARTGQITGVPDELAGQIPRGGLPAALGGLISGIGSAVGGLVSGMGTSVSSVASGLGKAVSSIGSLFFKAREGGAKEADAEEIRSRLGPGQPLDSGVKQRMESAFGHSFSRVRVHNDAGAGQLSEGLNAKAFTVGEHIAFGAGEYRPATIAGDVLIAHELAHVVQQSTAAPQEDAQRMGTAYRERLEQDADQSAVRAAANLWGLARQGLTYPTQHAKPALKSGLKLQRCKGSQSDSPGKTTSTPTLALSDDSYDDSGGESHKKIKFDVSVPNGVAPQDYALVNKLKGFEKAGDGTFFKVKMYENSVNFNFPDWQVDSVDPDPVYWSKGTTRWRYNSTTGGFYATDDPGPALSSEHGAVYAVNFKIGLYKLADLPATTTGTINATALDEKPWQYSVRVGNDGTFTHPGI
jgi:hypothetical protein